MSSSGGVEETEKSLEKQLEEMREQLKKERDEWKEKDEELKTTKEQLSKEREERMAEKRELEKLRRQTPGKIGCMDEGVLRMQMDMEKISEEESVYSDYAYIGGVPFRLECESNTDSVTKDLAVYLRCNDIAPTKTFSASVDFTVTMVSTVTPRSLSHCYTFNPSVLNRGWPTFIAWVDAMDPSKGYVKDGHITIEAKIKLICFYKNAIYDFSSPDPLLTDVTLIVGGKEFNVSKKHISIYSDFFKTLFLSDCAEKEKGRVELPEVDAKEFKDLLRMMHPQRNTTVGHLIKRMIHPERRKITVTKDNVEYLLRLADYFTVDVVRWQCIDFLKETTDFLPAAKLQLTDQYRLPELQADILGKMKTRVAAKEVIDSPEFKSYSDPLKNFVLQKHYTLL